MAEKERILLCNLCDKTEVISCQNTENGRFMQKNIYRKPLFVTYRVEECGRRQAKIEQSRGKERISLSA